MAISLFTAGCASAIRLTEIPSASEIPALEARLAADSTSFPVLLRLGLAYRNAQRLDEARKVLERARARQSKHPAATAYLGLTYEELQLPGEALALYHDYLKSGVSPDVRKALRQRTGMLERQQLRLAAKKSIADETALSGADPEPRTVAVFPFLYRGTDPQLAPLTRALAEMLVTDLSQTSRLSVLERVRVQALMDELELARSDRFDQATTARAGRLLRAERVVQGELAGNEELLRLGAAVVASRGEREGFVSEEDALRSLFDMMKRLALSLYRSLDIVLTAAERDRVERRATSSLPALVAFGRCLEAEDNSQFEAAAQHCAHAASLDPGFAAARERAALLENLATAADLTTAELVLMIDVDVAVPEQFVGAEHVMPAATVRDAAVESAGVEGVRKNPSLEIIIRRP